jgi:acetyl esterase/lipase
MSESRDVLSRPAPPPDVVLRYGADPDHVVDLRLPRNPARRLIVFLHGGFWRAAWDRTHTGPLASDLAARGYAVACVEYRRVGQPGGGWPGTFDDVRAALAALPDLVRPHVDPAGYVLAGHSAGGQLALLHGARAGAVLALAPVADLASAFPLKLDDDAVGDLLGGGPLDVPDRYDRADPARQPALTVPVTIVHGDADVIVPADLSRRYAATRTWCRLEVLPGVGHFDIIDPLSSAWLTVLAAFAQLTDGA